MEKWQWWGKKGGKEKRKLKEEENVKSFRAKGENEINWDCW